MTPESGVRNARIVYFVRLDVQKSPQLVAFGGCYAFDSKSETNETLEVSKLFFFNDLRAIYELRSARDSLPLVFYRSVLFLGLFGFAAHA